ncbi:MAG: hypothetical protein R2722_09745 [Tessaracoccus sp.]
MRVLRIVGWVLLVLGAVAAAALGLLNLFPIAQTWGTVLLGLSTFIPMMWIPAVVAIVGLAVVLRGRWKLVAAVLGLIALLVWGLPVMPRNQGVVVDMEVFPRDLGVVSANARYGAADVEQILAEAGDHVQVLAFQEYTPEFEERLGEAGAFEDFPYHVGEARTSAGGTVLLSRVPVEMVAETEGLPFLNFVAKLTVDGRDWYVGNIHSTGPHFGAREWAEDGDAIVEMVRPYLDEAIVLVGTSTPSRSTTPCAGSRRRASATPWTTTPSTADWSGGSPPGAWGGCCPRSRASTTSTSAKAPPRMCRTTSRWTAPTIKRSAPISTGTGEDIRRTERNRR